jgi:hypothetical protein
VVVLLHLVELTVPVDQELLVKETQEAVEERTQPLIEWVVEAVELEHQVPMRQLAVLAQAQVVLV